MLIILENLFFRTKLFKIKAIIISIEEHKTKYEKKNILTRTIVINITKHERIISLLLTFISLFIKRVNKRVNIINKVNWKPFICVQYIVIRRKVRKFIQWTTLSQQKNKKYIKIRKKNNI